MIAANYTTVRNNFKDYCDRVTDGEETLIVTRKDEKNVVILSARRYSEMEKALRNAAYLEKLDRGRRQVSAGLGIAKTIGELEAMEGDD
jgi:antitoxin YefM